MKGVLYYGNRNVKFSDKVKEPVIKVDDELIIDIAYCGICGSDLHEYLDGPIFFNNASTEHGDELSGEKLPLTLGHEFSGVVKEIGPGVKNLKVGDHVVVEATAHCSDRLRYPNNSRIKSPMCKACKSGRTNACHYLSFCGLGFSDGALSERVVTNEAHAVHLPKSIPLDIGALVEPLSVAWHAVRLSGLQPGDSALVLGAGPIGLATILALHGHQAGDIVVSEVAEIRREQAAKFGVKTFNPADHESPEESYAALHVLGGEEGFKYSFDASGVQATLDTSIEAIAAGGKAVNIAIWPNTFQKFKPMSVTLEEKCYCGSMCYTRVDFEQVIEAIEDGRIDIDYCRQMITGKVSLEDAEVKGFQELINHKEKNIKVMVTPLKVF